MHPDLLIELDREWATWSAAPRAESAFRRWAARESVLGTLDGFAGLLALFESRSPATHDARDAVLVAMIRLAPDDADAYRTLLHLLRAGLVNLATRANRWWSWEEATSAVMVSAVDRINRYPMRRTSRVAANLLGDIWHSVWTLRKAELRRASVDIELVELAGIEEVAVVDEPVAGCEVLALVDDAVRRGRISRRDGRFVALHRVFGLTNAQVAGIEGCRPCTIRKRRVAAEAALADLAVA